MPRKKVVPLERLDAELQAILEEYEEDIDSSVQGTVRKIAQKAAKAVRAEAHSKVGGSKYYKDWSYKSDNDKKRLHYGAVVYNKKHYQLAHLLEKGHVSKNGTGRTFGFVAGRPHIQPVEEQVIQDLYQDIVRIIK